MLKRLQRSMERINYQPRSVAFQELTTLHDDAIKAYASLSKQKFVNWMLVEYDKRLSEIIERNFNMRVEVLVITPGVDAGAAAILNHKDAGVNTIHHLVTGLPEKKNDLRDKFKDIMDILGRDIDIVNSKAGDLVYKAYGLNLQFGVGFIALSDATSNIRPFTGAELAAIMLHEIGHTFTYIEVATSTYIRSQMLKESFESLSKETWTKADIEFAADYIEKNAKVKVTLPPCLKTTASVVNPAAVAVGVLFVLLILTNIYKYTKKYITTAADNATRLSGRSFDGQKYSDTVFTTNNITHIERIADEFASRHGAAADLLSGLAKLMFLAQKPGMGPMYKKGAVSPGKILADVQIAVSQMDAWNELQLPIRLTSSYDDDILRLTKLIENNMAIFKDPKLSPDIRREWLDQTKRAKAYIDEFKSHNFVKWRMKWNEMLKSTSGGTLGGIFMDGNMVADYKVLQLLTDTFIRNPLYMASADLADHHDTITQKR